MLKAKVGPWPVPHEPLRPRQLLHLSVPVPSPARQGEGLILPHAAEGRVRYVKN